MDSIMHEEHTSSAVFHEAKFDVAELALVDRQTLLKRVNWNLLCANISPGHRFSLLTVGVDNLWVYADCLGTHAADRLLMAVAKAIVPSASMIISPMRAGSLGAS